MLRRILLLILVGIVITYCYFYYSSKISNTITEVPIYKTFIDTSEKNVNIPVIKNENKTNIPETKILVNNYHVFQTFNNCGPAALSMALSYYGYSISQKELGDSLRPYQISNGDNDDKSTSLEELGKKASEYDLIPYHRQNGNIDLIKKFISNDIPVITRTWLTEDEDIGHYRIVKGYSDKDQMLIQDDSFDGKNLIFSYDDFNKIWEKFNFEYLVLIPKEKIDMAKDILKSDFNEQVSWENSVKLLNEKLLIHPNDVNLRFNLSVAYFKLGKMDESIQEFEKVENSLNPRALWYQIEPIEAYYEIGNFDRVFSLTNKILTNGNRAYSEAYILRGKSYLKLEKYDQAKSEFEKAVFYNVNLKEAKDLLNSI